MPESTVHAVTATLDPLAENGGGRRGSELVQNRTLATLGLLALWFSCPGCHRASQDMSDLPPIVGAWIVRAPAAPFPLHLFVFHSDGTVQQSNPDAGDPHTSDSNALGAWAPDGDGVRGKIVEITADRATHQFVSRGEISFALKVTGSEFRGTASANFYDAAGRLVRGPVHTPLEGRRVLP